LDERVIRLEGVATEHEFKLLAAEKREEGLLELREALGDVHQSLANTVAAHSKELRANAKQNVEITNKMDGLSKALEAMTAHVTNESATRIKDFEKEKLQRESLAEVIREGATSLEAATPAAHARQMMMAATLAVSVICKSVAEDFAHNKLASWLVVGVVLVLGYLSARKRKAVP
jgi:hypothetical protein